VTSVSFSDAEIDAAITALSDPGRLAAAQDIVARAAPSLQRVLGSALHEGGWFDTAHEAAIKDALELPDPHDRIVAVRTLMAEETRLTMLVGVAVGFELARELGYGSSETVSGTATEEE
jgi:hypothetical protein